MSSTDGACNCGAIKVHLKNGWGDNKGVICHCINCRKSGGAIASYNSPFPIKDVVWTGTPKIYKQPLEGTDAFVQRWFCGDCGSTLASVSERAPDTIFVKVPLFDTPPPLGAEVFRKRAYEYVPEMAGACFEAMPPA